MYVDPWKQYVSLEISDAFADDDRLLEITQALLGMQHADLIPQDIADDLFNQIDMTNEGGA